MQHVLRPGAIPPHRRLLRLIVDHNPFFLLSGVCMLAGCYLVNAAAHEDPSGQVHLGLLLGLLGVFNLYEVLVIGLGVYLLQSRRLVRDTGWLFLLELLLLVDVTMLYNEVFTASFGVGVLVVAAALALAVAKVGVMAEFLSIRLRPSAWALVGLDLLLLFGLPGVFRTLKEAGAMTPVALYLAWCGMGLLVALHGLPVRWTRVPLVYATVGEPALRRVFLAALATLPVLSVLGHLRAAHYVYDIPVNWADYAPVVLGAAAWAVQRYATPAAARAWRRAAVALGAAAVVLSLDAGPALVFVFPGDEHLVWSPLRVMLLASAGFCAATWWRLGGALLPAGAAVAVPLALAGHDPRAMLRSAHAIADWLTAAGDRMIPTTTLGWGIASIGAAFALLVVGGAVSLLKRPQPVPAPGSPESPGDLSASAETWA